MEEGRRLENLSWRLWNRETFCCDSKPRFPDTPTSRQHTPKPYPSKKHTPELSASVDSITSTEEEEDDDDEHQSTRSIHIKRMTPDMSSPESFSSVRSRCKPISPDELERMVVSIKDTKVRNGFDLVNLSTSLTEALSTVSVYLEPPTILQPPPAVSQQKVVEKDSSFSPFSTAPRPSPASVTDLSQAVESDTSMELGQSHSVVRGFAPNRISSSHRSSASIVSGKSPVVMKSVLRNATTTSNMNNNFMLGGSSDDESSFDELRSHRRSASSLTAGLKQPQQQHTPKMTTFQEEVEIRGDQADEGAIDSDDSDAESDISESAIEEEEEEEEEDAWEDDDLDAAEDKDHQALFQRVSSKPNLASRRSLLTSLVHESERATALTAQASKSQPSLPQLSKPKPSIQIADPPKASGIARSKPMAMPASASQTCAFSPRTTRRNMLSTELTESLRQNLLWERQFKNTTAQAFLKRRHTAHENLGQLKQHPTAATDSESPSRKTSWDNVFNSNNEYNTRGW